MPPVIPATPTIGPYMTILRDNTNGLSDLLTQAENTEVDPISIVEGFVDLTTTYLGSNRPRVSAITRGHQEALLQAVGKYQQAMERAEALPRALQARGQILGGLEQVFQSFGGMFLQGLAEDVANEIGYTPTGDDLQQARMQGVQQALANLYIGATTP